MPEISQLSQRVSCGGLELAMAAVTVGPGVDQRKVVFTHVLNPLGYDRDVNPVPWRRPPVRTMAKPLLMFSLHERHQECHDH